MGSPDDVLSVVLVDDPSIADINERYLNHQGPTNVISFSMREGEFGDINPHVIGDVVISMDTCVREAQQGGISSEQRFYELLIHGILHLFGYDHLESEGEARIMDDKSRELMEMLDKFE